MRKSKLIDRLRLLERDELRDFTKFLESPYYNTNEKVIRLFEDLKAYYPVFESEDLEREQVARRLFPEWTNNTYKKLSHVMSDLSQLLDRFFVIRVMEKDNLEYYQSLLQAYKQRSGDWFFSQTANELERYLAKTPERNTNYYYHQYRLNHERYTHTATERIRTGIESLEKTIQNLDYFYFGMKLRYSSEVRFRELYLSEKSELVLLDEILEIARHPTFTKEGLIHVFSTIVRLYQTKNKVDYDTLKLLIINHFDEFGGSEKFDILTMANNFCIMEYNQGKTDYLTEIFGWYEYGLTHGVWTAGGHIDHQAFDNIVSVACRLKKSDWTVMFIRKHAKYLRDEVRESVKTMAWCRLELSRNNCEAILELLRDVEFVDVRYSLTAKAYQLISYYELSGYEVVFYDACSAFAKYCRRNTVIGKQSKELNLNFVAFIKRLYQAKHQQTETKKDLLEKLTNTSLPFSDWLQEKVEQDIK